MLQGNYFIAGGQVNGGKVFGKFIEKMSGDHPLVFRPGSNDPNDTMGECMEWSSTVVWSQRGGP